MAWHLHPEGVEVIIDYNTRSGQELAQEIKKKGLSTIKLVMRVVENKMIPGQDDEGSWPETRRIPRIIVALQNGTLFETEPVALSRAS